MQYEKKEGVIFMVALIFMYTNAILLTLAH